jgi:RHS repeat-associated protein
LPIEQVTGSTPQYYLQDQLGSTRGLTDSTGAIVATYSYDAYGAVTGSSGTAGTPFQYAGQYTDGESGLQYLRARYYDPQTAQFVSVDPLVALTQQPYGYAGQSPMNLGDPSGLCDTPFGSVPFGTSNNCSDDFGATVYNAVSGAANAAATPAYAPGQGDLPSLVRRAQQRGTGAIVPYYDALLEAGSLVPGPGKGVGALEFAGEHFSVEQQIIIDLAQDAVRGKGICERDAQTLLEWAREYGLTARDDTSIDRAAHWSPRDASGVARYPNGVPHIHIGPINHIPVRIPGRYP